MSTGEQTRSKEFESRLEFETLLADLSSRFINISPDDLDREIENALRRVCEFLDIDRAVLWQWSNVSPDLIVPTHAYSTDEGMRPTAPMNQDMYPWSREQLRAGRAFSFSSMDDLPPEAAVDRETCLMLGVKAAVGVPLSVGGEPPVGALGFNTLRSERLWPEALVNRLNLVAQIFANALARRRSEMMLRESEERLSLAADSAGAALWTLDYASGIFWVTDRARGIFGFLPGEVIDMDRLKALIHPEDWGMVRDVIDGARRQRERVSVEYRILPGDGSVRWISSGGRPVFGSDGEAERLTGVSVDITERKRAEDELRELSRRLIQAHEEERAILARELHDDVTQRLAVLAIDVGRAELAAAGSEQAETMRAVRDGLVRISEDIHTLAYHLHPSVLEELGLVEALRTECERFERRWSIGLALELGTPPVGVGKDVALCLFRVAQEALNNVARHAGAHAARVTLQPMDDGLLLAVRDDGVGFDPQWRAKGTHLGLLSMRERIRLVDGSLDIESAPGRGTTVVAWVPAQGRPL